MYMYTVQLYIMLMRYAYTLICKYVKTTIENVSLFKKGVYVYLSFIMIYPTFLEVETLYKIIFDTE